MIKSLIGINTRDFFYNGWRKILVLGKNLQKSFES